MYQREKWGKRPSRFLGARSDASVGTITKRIAEVFKVPAESVQLVNKRGKPMKLTAKIGKLRAHWTPQE